MPKSFSEHMKGYIPRSVAGFLATEYRRDAAAFAEVSPDELLVNQFGTDAYVQLADLQVVPIAAVPAGIVLAET